MKEEIIIFGDDQSLKEAAHKYRDHGHRVQVRSLRSLTSEFEQCDRVILLEENSNVRDRYESRGIKVELDTLEAIPVPTRDEIEALPWAKRKAAIKRLTGQAPYNGIEAAYLLNQHFGDR